MKTLSVIAAVVVGFILLDIPDKKPQAEAAPVAQSAPDCSAEINELHRRIDALERQCDANACRCNVESSEPAKAAPVAAGSPFRLAPGEILSAIEGRPVNRSTTVVTTGEVVTATPVEAIPFPTPSAGVVSGSWQKRCDGNSCQRVWVAN